MGELELFDIIAHHSHFQPSNLTLSLIIQAPILTSPVSNRFGYIKSSQVYNNQLSTIYYETEKRIRSE
jgi:hypothetical protein